MITTCIICGTIYNSKGIVKNYPFHAKVCGKECFIRLLSKRMPSKYTKVPYGYTDKMLRFEDSDLEMRSNYEKGFATWLKTNNITFFYEPYLFYLDGFRGYVPDFFLPYSNSFIEVKGKWQGNSFSKFKQFKKEFNHCIYLVDKEFMTHIKCGTRREFLW